MNIVIMEKGLKTIPKTLSPGVGERERQRAIRFKDSPQHTSLICFGGWGPKELHPKKSGLKRGLGLGVVEQNHNPNSHHPVDMLSRTIMECFG